MIGIFRRRTTSSKPARGLANSVPPDLRWSTHENGLVVMNLTTGAIFTSNKVGVLIWARILNRETPQEIGISLSAEFGIPKEQAQRDTARFVAELYRNNLLYANS